MSKHYEKNKKEKDTIIVDEETEKRVTEFIAEAVATYNFRKQNKELRETEGLRGFKQYKNACRKGKAVDCDCCDLVMQIWCLIIKRTKNVKNISYSGRIISYETEGGEHFQIETDTMISLETPFNDFVRKILSEKYGQSWKDLYMGGKGICNSKVIDDKWTKTGKHEINRDEWLLKYWNEVFDQTIVEGDAYKQYEQFANLIHTLGNFILGPVGFNSKAPNAKAKFKDRMDLFLLGIYKRQNYCPKCKEWVEWFQDNQDILFLEDFCTSGDIFKEDSYTDLTDISTVNDLIRKRGISIAKWLLKELDFTNDSLQ